MKFAANGLLYRGSKPVMWSVVEKTALAEAEVEYEDHVSDTVWVKFPVRGIAQAKSAAFGEDAAHQAALSAVLKKSSVVIWTTTPWTLPGNRAISFSAHISYGLYRVTASPSGNWAGVGETFILADKLSEDVFRAAKVEAFERLDDVQNVALLDATCFHPLKAWGYDFVVPLLDGDHVTDDAGTGFVHTAPGHGVDDFNIWLASGRLLAERGIDTRIPYTVDEDGFYTDRRAGLCGQARHDREGRQGRRQ